MAGSRFETQPYYDVQDVVYDTRLVEPLGNIAAANAIREGMGRVGADPRLSSRFKTDYANQLEAIHATGRDGETSSGGIDMLQVTRPEGTEVTVVSSGLWDHRTGLPEVNCSWSAEFDDQAIAKAFWKRKWRPNFDGTDFFDNCRAYIKECGDLPVGSIRFQWTGLLTSWYHRKVDEFLLLEQFATAPDRLLRIPRGPEIDSNYTVGQVYKVPHCPWYSNQPEAWAAQTCLTALIVQPDRSNFFGEKRPTTVIQWDNGSMSYYSHQDMPRPQALTPKDIVPTQMAVAP